VDVLQTQDGLLQITDNGIATESGKTLLNLSWDNLVMSTGLGLRFTLNQLPFRFYFVKRFSFDGTKFDLTPAGTDSDWGFVISMTQALN
jgi:hypothetical protein